MPMAISIKYIPARIYLLNVNNSNTTRSCEICSKLMIKIPDRHHGIVLLLFLLTLKISDTLFFYFYCYLWRCNCLLRLGSTFLTQFTPISHFHTPQKAKTRGFPTSSEEVKMKRWYWMVKVMQLHQLFYLT